MQYREWLVSGIRSVLHDHLNALVESPEADLLDTGLVDSIGLVELVLHLEDRFSISLPIEALEIDDLRSINSIADLITRISSISLARAVGE
jgi:methoxymalonate biosynthesis acyl carrier protein